MAVAFTSTELSRYFASFSGMDGGNLQAKLWICGIEHGSDSEELSDIKPERKPGAWDAEKRAAFATKFRRWPYWRNIAKIVVGTRHAVAAKAGSALKGMDWREYRDVFLYSRQGWEFKLNLFPLSSPSVSSGDWAKVHGHEPELGDKENYRRLCREGGRFEFIRNLRRQHQPAVIIATGVGNRDDFVSAFGFNDCTAEEVIIEHGTTQRRLYVYVDRYADGRHSVLVVTPFPGSPSGLNSTSLINELATYVATWMSPADFHELSAPDAEQNR
jgi:transcriptional activator of eps genes